MEMRSTEMETPLQLPQVREIGVGIALAHMVVAIPDLVVVVVQVQSEAMVLVPIHIRLVGMEEMELKMIIAQDLMFIILAAEVNAI